MLKKQILFNFAEPPKEEEEEGEFIKLICGIIVNMMLYQNVSTRYKKCLGEKVKKCKTKTEA